VADTGFDVADTTPDTGLDTAVDSTVDTVTDPGHDPGPDTGFDSGHDTWLDTGVDTWLDTGHDTATDPTTDAPAGIVWCVPYPPSDCSIYPTGCCPVSRLTVDCVGGSDIGMVCRPPLLCGPGTSGDMTCI
jgi:hypothetical protein